MNAHLTRRQFLRAAAATAAGAAGATKLPAAGDDRPFSFLALGDTHFDRLQHHDMDWLRREHPGDVAQVEHYCRHTAELLPELLAALHRRVRDCRPEVSLVVHAGDLVEGLCGTAALARKQCEDVVAFLVQADLGVPFLLSKGNHDVTGPGAADAYGQILLAYLGRQLGRQLPLARYSLARHGCLFVFYDCYDKASLAWLREALASTAARQVFVVVHQPVVPFQARANWSLFARPEQRPQRAELLELLGRHRAIVIAGHVHRYGLVARKTAQGKFLQVALCSVLGSKTQQPREVLEGVDKYGPDLVELEPDFQADRKDECRRLLEAEAPRITHFEYANTAGYALLKVADRAVSVDVYNGASDRPWKSIDCSELLA